MVWDETTPAGTEAISNGDNRIRELKTDIAAALTTEGSFPGADTSNPKFRWTPSRGNTAARPASPVSGQLYLNTQTGAMERYNGSAWASELPIIPAGTAMVFYQASAPAGWTAVAVNDKFLRVVTSGGTGGTNGGTVAASTSLAHTHTLTHTHDLGNHTHSTPTHDHNLYSTQPNDRSAGLTDFIGSSTATGALSPYTAGGGGSVFKFEGKTVTSGSGTSGTPSSNTSGAASTDTTSSQFAGAFAYADVVVATKD